MPIRAAEGVIGDGTNASRYELQPTIATTTTTSPRALVAEERDRGEGGGERGGQGRRKMEDVHVFEQRE
jgi:hypothetical protein